MISDSGIYNLRRKTAGKIIRTIGLCFIISTTTTAFASGPIFTVQTTSEPAIPLSYSKGGSDYHWGQGDNLYLTGFLFDSDLDGQVEQYIPRLTTQNVILIRGENPTANSERCSIFAEIHGDGLSYKPSLPLLNTQSLEGEFSCDIEAILANNIINIGVKNINVYERIDYIFSTGIIVPEQAKLAQAGHIVTDKASAADSAIIAAITAINASGNPIAFGNMVNVGPNGTVQMGNTNISAMYDFLQNEQFEPRGYPVFVRDHGDIQIMTAAFITLDDLGISAGQEYYGFSMFSANRYSSPPNGADIYGGLAALYMVDSATSNGSPVANNDAASTTLNTTVTINILDNDSDPDSDPLTIVSATSAQGGTIIINPDQSITYTPPAGFTGTDTISYEISDGNGGTATATVTIRVTNPDPDFDNDGIIDAIDIDDDNDGILDTVEGNADLDRDGIPNHLDLDSDGDGILDLEESGLNEALQSQLDTDDNGQIDAGNPVGENGLADDVETAIDTDLTDYNSDGQADSVFDIDRDSRPDFMDFDTDNDGLSDVIEGGFLDADNDGMMDSGQTPTISPPDSNEDGLADYRDPNLGEGAGNPDGSGGVLQSGLQGEGASLGILPLLFLVFGGLLKIISHPYNLKIVRHKSLHNRNTYYKRGMPVLAISLLVMLPAIAIADPSIENRKFDKRFYLGAGAGMSELEPRHTLGYFVVDDKNDTAGQIFFGYDLTKRFSIEAFYTDLGEAGIATASTGIHAGQYAYKLYGASAIGYLYNSRGSSDYDFSNNDNEGYYRREGLSLYARVGISGMDNDSSLNYDTINNTDLHFGGGVEYGFSNGIALRADFVSYDKDAKLVTLAVVKRFGKVSKPIIPKPLVVAEVATPPATKEEPKEASPPTVILRIVHFGFDRSDLSVADRNKLNALAVELKKYPELMLEVSGHTDSVGTRSYNQSLSERRAQAATKYLVSIGVNSSQLITRGYGEDKPIATNATKEGRSKNRRTDFTNNDSKLDFEFQSE